MYGAGQKYIDEAQRLADYHGLSIEGYQFEKNGKKMFAIEHDDTAVIKPNGKKSKKIDKCTVKVPIDQKEDACDAFLRNVQNYDTAKTGDLH